MGGGGWGLEIEGGGIREDGVWRLRVQGGGWMVEGGG